MMLTLRKSGIQCYRTKCENGFTSYRPFVPRISKNFSSLVLESNISFINFGLHYNLPEEYEAEMKVGIPSLVESQRKYNKTIFWIDSFIPHFPISDGSYYKYMNDHSKPKEEGGCAPIQEMNDWRNEIADKYLAPYANQIKRIKIRDIVAHRYDTQNGILTHFSSQLLDCVHHCMQPCFWEPILFRIATALHETLS